MKLPGEKKNRDIDIPTASFVDIAFLLIIYFLAATSLVKIKSITADLPSGAKSASPKTEKTTTINLRGSEIFLNDKAIDMEILNERLAALELGSLAPEKRIILLEAAKGTPYQNYFQTLAAISANGGVVALVEDEESK